MCVEGGGPAVDAAVGHNKVVGQLKAKHMSVFLCIYDQHELD